MSGERGVRPPPDPRRPALLAPASLLALLASLAVAAPAGAAEPVVPSLSTGDACGPFAAALGGDGRLHLAWVERASPDASARLLYRVESGPDRWGDPEPVLARGVERLGLAVAAPGPVIVFSEGGAVHAATRTADGWGARRIADSALEPGPFAVVERDGRAEALVALGRGPGGAPALRRAPLAPAPLPPASDHPLPDPAAGRVDALAAAAAPGGHVVAFSRSATLARVLTLGEDGRPRPARVATLAWTRVASELLPPIVLPAAGALGPLAVAPLDGGHAILFATAGAPPRRLVCRLAGREQLGAQEVLLEGADEVRALAASGRGRGLVLAAVLAGPDGARLETRRFDGQLWGEWAPPPGRPRDPAMVPVAVEVAIDARDGARLVTQERSAVDGRQRLVEWVTPPGRTLRPMR